MRWWRNETGIRVSWTGIAGARDDERLCRASGGARDVCRSVGRAGRRPVATGGGGTGGGAQPDHQHAAGDADRRRGDLPRLACFGRRQACRRRRPQPGRIHGAGCRGRAGISPMRSRWCAFARRRCRTRCRRASAPWPPSWAATTMPWRRRAWRPRRARWSNRSISMRRDRSSSRAIAKRSSAPSRWRSRRAPNAACCCRSPRRFTVRC